MRLFRWPTEHRAIGTKFDRRKKALIYVCACSLANGSIEVVAASMQNMEK